MRNIAKAFDQYADDYDKWFDSSEGKILFEMEIEAVRLLKKNIEHPFLEIGIGSGRFAKELGIDFGIDPSYRLLEIAKRRGIRVEMAIGENLPYRNNSFGGIFILFTLCFVENPERVLLESRRVLKKDGGLIIGIINRESLWGKLYIKKGNEGHPIYRYAKFYTIDAIRGLIERAEMKVEGYSSTLCQSSSEKPYKEAVHNQLINDAGFICVLARKNRTYQ